jgi:hypothetical protein
MSTALGEYPSGHMAPKPSSRWFRNPKITTTVPSGATTGTIEVVTPSGTLSSNVSFQVQS